MSTAGAAPLLAIRGLSVTLPGSGDRALAVDRLSLELAAEEILCVVGESGSGKSVTAQAVMGLLPPELRVTAGAVAFEGRDLLGLAAHERRALGGAAMAMIFQEPRAALNPVWRVGRQIEEQIAVHAGLPAAARRARVRELLAEVRLPDPERVARAYPHELSGGQCQRVLIAMALSLGPRLLIADEPTTALDVTTQAQILRLIRELQRRRGTGVLFITHDFGVVADIADRVAVLERGVLVEAGPADDVLFRPQHAYTRRLLAAVPRLRPRAAGSAGARALEVAGLTKTWRRRAGFLRRGTPVHAARDVSLVLEHGRTLGVVGESGSGKTTVAQAVIRLIEADAGAIRLGAVDLAALSQRALRPYRKGIQIVFQDPWTALDPRQRVGDAIAEGPVIHGTPRAAALARARDLLALVGLEPAAAARFPHQFSGGQRQRICIARALALEPAVLVADEPVSSLDVSVQAQVLALLADLQARLGFAMLLITHDLRVAAQVCDRVAVMQGGAIVEEGPTAQVFERPAHAYTRMLIDAIPGRRLLEREV